MKHAPWECMLLRICVPSALDIYTEEKIINNIFKDNIEYTIFLITHRLQALKQCNTIYKLNNQILQNVSFKELNKAFYSENS